MIRLRVSRRVLRIAGWIVLAAALLGGLYGLGEAVTPRDGQARPLLLSPSLRAAERYRSRARGWVAETAEIDRRLTALLAGEAAAGGAVAGVGELYAASREMQAVGERAAGLVREVAQEPAPVALVGLQAAVQATAEAHLEAAVSTAYWVSAPSEAARREALATLRQARALRTELEGSRWLRASW